MVRKPFVAGNWKMFTHRASARELAAAVARGAGAEARVDVAVCPPFPYLLPVAEALAGSAVALGAQNCFYENEGAFTGEVSPSMLADVGCTYVILGHSERRHKLGESDAFINKKVAAALRAGLRVILCVGETLQEREANATEKVLAAQLAGSLAGLLAEPLAGLVIAYEPVWAIGTGKTATPEQAQQAHAFVRAWLRAQGQTGEERATRLPIVYGGSVTPEKAPDLMRQPDIDGGLIGGASLKADAFLAIVRAAAEAKGR
jgi:triosephosphate isomerase